MLIFLIEQKNQYFSKNERKTLTLRPSCGSHQDRSVAQTECPLSLTPGQWVDISNTPSQCFVFAFVFVFVFLSPLWAAWCAGSGHCRQPLHGSTSTSCFLNLQSWWWWWFWSQGAVLRRYYSEITLWLYPPGFSWGLQGLNCWFSKPPPSSTGLL